MSAIIIDLKKNPNDKYSNYVRDQLHSIKSNHRLNKNYIDFDPWSDCNFLTYNALIYNEEIVSVGGLQKKDFFPEKTCRANARHFVFSKFRSKQISKTSISKLDDGFIFGGALIRHHMLLARDLNLGAVFVSRDRGLRSFSYLMEETVNKYLPTDFPKINVINNLKFNVCNNIELNECWQYLAVCQLKNSFDMDTFNQLPVRESI